MGDKPIKNAKDVIEYAKNRAAEESKRAGSATNTTDHQYHRGMVVAFGEIASLEIKEIVVKFGAVRITDSQTGATEIWPPDEDGTLVERAQKIFEKKLPGPGVSEKDA